ncbi:MAG: MMPL family transporter, partial [Alphaproteobacteria bacterium]|nr:MMPL family transporter [Alphaproteobacteria bacterium]
VEHVRQMVKEAEASHPDLRFAVSGTAVINYVLDEMTLRDLQTLLPFVYVTLLALLLVLIRSVAGVLATALVITVAGVGAMGFAALSGIALTTASAGAPTIILTLAVADSVHFLASARDARLQGMSNFDALAESMRINFEPILLTSLTTLIGFLSLNFSEAPPFRDLGNITAVGVVLAWASSLTLLPAVLSYLPWGKRPASRLEIRVSGRYADFVVVHRNRILVYSGLVALVLIALAPTNTLDDQVVEWFGEETEIRRDTDFITEHLIGPYRVEFSVRAPDEGGIADPRYLADLEQFRAWLAAHPKVAHVDSFTHIIKRVNRDFHDGDETYYRIPQDRQLAAQYILLYELSLPYGLDLNSQVTIDKSATRLTATLGEITSAETRHFKEEADDWAHRNLDYASVREGTGTAVMFAYVARRTIESMFFGTALAFVLISLTLVLALRSVKLGLISILPNVLPVMVTFGLWSLFVGEIGVVASGIVAMTLGLVVDDTVHFLSKYHRARYEHCLNAHDGIRFVFEHVGRALVTTTLVLVAGFSVLILSDFLLNWQMGLLVVMTISIALVLDFLLLPALLM